MLVNKCVLAILPRSAQTYLKPTANKVGICKILNSGAVKLLG
jgi:hypothetical protein